MRRDDKVATGCLLAGCAGYTVYLIGIATIMVLLVWALWTTIQNG